MTLLFLLFSVEGGRYAIRLAGTSSNNRGRVEIYHPSYGWYTACDDYWDSNEGRVVCRQLGYSGVSRVLHGAYYGRGSSRGSFFELPRCSGSEVHIWDCSTWHPRWNIGCGHHEDVSVDCY